MPTPRIVIVGGGAMGSLFAAHLARAGLDTAILHVARPVVDAIAESGITLAGGDDGEVVVRVPSATSPDGLGPVDVVLFFVKCYQTEAAAELARPLVRAGTTVVSLQNGWGNGEVLAARYPPGQIVQGVPYVSSTTLAPARISGRLAGRTLVGAYDGAGDERAAAVAGILTRAGFDAGVERSIATEIWK